MSKINIIYLVPELKGAAGGAKVVYDHSLILNNHPILNPLVTLYIHYII